MEKPEFTPDMLISEVVEYYPGVVPVFMEYGLFCVGCHVSSFETVREGAYAHGIEEDDFENMIADAKDALKRND